MKRGYRIRARSLDGKLYLHKQIYKEEEKKKARQRLLELKRNAEFLQIRADTLEIVPVERANAQMKMGEDENKEEGDDKWEDEDKALYQY